MRVMKSMIHPLESTTLYEQHVPGGASAEYACFAQQRGQRADACADTSTSVPHPLAYIEMGVPTPPRHLVLSFTTATPALTQLDATEQYYDKCISSRHF